MPRSWVKSWVETLDNPKVMEHGFATIGLYETLLLVAARHDEDGVLPPPERIAYMIRKDTEQIRKGMDTLTKLHLLEQDAEGVYRVHDWDDWQGIPEYPSTKPDAAAERKRKQRERERAERDAILHADTPVTSVTSRDTRDEDKPVTNMSRMSQATNVTSRDRDNPVTNVTTEESRVDQTRVDEMREEGDANASLKGARPARGKSDKGTLINPDFPNNEQAGRIEAWAREKRYDIAAVMAHVERFKLWAETTNTPAKFKRDWTKAFMGYVTDKMPAPSLNGHAPDADYIPPEPVEVPYEALDPQGKEWRDATPEQRIELIKARSAAGKRGRK